MGNPDSIATSCTDCGNGETVWLTQKQMAAHFDVDVRTASEHLGNVLASGARYLPFWA